LRVLLVSQYFWPENFLVNDLARGLTERGHEVTVLTGKPNYPNGSFFEGYDFFRPVREQYEGATVLRVPLVPRGRGGRLLLSINYLSFVLFAGILGPLLCRERYDVVLVYEPSPVTVGLPAIVMGKLKRAPIMFWVQDLWPESVSAAGAVRSPRVLGWVEKLVRFIYRRCDAILVQSRAFTARVEALGVDPAKIFYFPNWAEGFYRPVALEKGSSEESEMPPGFRVIFAGNVGASQGFDTILAAAAKLREHEEIKWVIIGEGRMKPSVEEGVRRWGLEDRVHLLGRRSPEQMPRYYSLSDVLLVTLKRDPIFSLTLPSKTPVYLACGRPIVAALDGEGARVVKESGAGTAVPAGDAGALAEAVLEMYRATPEEREEMGRRGRAYFEEQFEREKLLDRLKGWMRELAGGGR
jgi:colanic acid biosynthesis glycosyl transferase WcaI